MELTVASDQKLEAFITHFLANSASRTDTVRDDLHTDRPIPEYTERARLIAGACACLVVATDLLRHRRKPFLSLHTSILSHQIRLTIFQKKLFRRSCLARYH
jgi:hypothetical protein